MNKFLAGLAVGVSLCASAAPALAGRLADVEIVSRSDGRTLPVWRHDGRLYVAGNPGEAYSLRVTNRSGGRLLSVVSVDGVNVLSGDTASASQSGYVLTSWQPAEIRGWRKSLDEVAQFTFTSLSNSYAARTGRPGNVGVIGVALFREYAPPPPPPVSIERRQRAEPYAEAPAGSAAAPAAPADRALGEGVASSRAESRADSSEMARGSVAPRPAEKLGTGHGAREYDRTEYTEFRRASSSPAEVITIYYDSHANLVAQGVIPREPYYGGNPRPHAFPADPRGRFVPDPAG